MRSALEQPLDYPPLHQIVVPGDRLVIAFDPTIAPGPGDPRAPSLRRWGGGSGPGNITVVAPRDGAGLAVRLPAGVSLVVHDPNDRAELAYLATTKQGRRIYLNRHLTDADVVVPVARLGYDPILGYRGPWSLLFPELSDRETNRGLSQPSRSGDSATGSRSEALSKLDESFEVSWLLGSQFHVGLVPASAGIMEAVAGRETTVRDRGSQRSIVTGSSGGIAGRSGRGGDRPAWIAHDAGGSRRRACSRPLGWSGMAARSSRCRARRASSARRFGLSADSTIPERRRHVLRGHESDDDYLVAPPPGAGASLG